MYTVPLHHALMDSCIDHPSEVTARNLTLTAKVVQNMANFAPFGAKEAFMIPCNDFLQSMRPKIISFFDTVSNPKLGAKFERPPRNAARALASIFRYYEANQAVSACVISYLPLTVLQEIKPLQDKSVGSRSIIFSNMIISYRNQRA